MEMPVRRRKLNSRLFLALLLLISGTSARLFAQDSSAAAVSDLHASYEKDSNSLNEILSSVPGSPSGLEDGSLATQLTSLQSDLSTLFSRVNQARQIIADKRNSLEGKGLSESDLKELRSALDRQDQPLDQLKSSISALDAKISDICTKEIPLWSKTYRTYADVEGADAAKTKLRASISSYKPPTTSTH
jgi:chromosome segregation ATPase